MLVRLRKRSFVALLALSAAGMTTVAWAQPPSQADKPPEPAKTVELTLSPAPEVRPALKYRFVPLVSELNPGDAAPIYLRIRHQVQDDRLKEVNDRDSQWIELPLEKLPVAEARDLVDRWGGVLAQLDLAAYREYCDWSYTLREQRLDAITILLPDVQEMRTWARLLRTKVRTEVAEKKYDSAIRTIESGITLGQHVGQGPFLISGLVGNSIVNMMLDRVEELISQPDAPNCYWALTVLPRPVVSLRNALENEQRLGEWMVPELAEVDKPHSPAGWSALLERLVQDMARVGRKLTEADEMSADTLKQVLALGVKELKSTTLADARKFYLEQRALGESQVKAMTDDELVARYLADTYREARDRMFRVGYLPYTAQATLAPSQSPPRESAKTGALAIFALLQPAVVSALRAETRLDRRVAALRVVEAIRMHAAANGGTLPDRLEDITVVPAPIDPGTAKPFEYTRDGDTARLTCPLLTDVSRSNVDYIIRIRK